MVFVDALDDYSHLRKVMNRFDIHSFLCFHYPLPFILLSTETTPFRMIDWFAVDATTFQDAYISLCIPKLASPYVRIQLITADILNVGDLGFRSEQPKTSRFPFSAMIFCSLGCRGIATALEQWRRTAMSIRSTRLSLGLSL